MNDDRCRERGGGGEEKNSLSRKKDRNQKAGDNLYRGREKKDEIQP